MELWPGGPEYSGEGAFPVTTDSVLLAAFARVKPGDHVVALCIDGRQMTSEQLAARVRALEDRGVQRALFVIGGSLGLSDAVVRRADERLSFSPMTFPHQLARVMLLEQLYRARKIGANERYHK